MENNIKIIEGGVRKFKSKSIIQLFRNWRFKNKLSCDPQNIYVEKSVEILRHPQNLYLSDNIIIKEGAKLCPTNDKAVIKIGHNTTIGYYSMIFSSNRIEIGDNCLIAPFVYLVDAIHGTKKGELINKQKLIAKTIKIHDDVWIATGSKILAGAEISSGSVISAGSVVSGLVPENAIIAGNPGRVISYREE